MSFLNDRLRRAVEVPHRRVDVRVAHPLLHLQDGDARVANDLRAERVAQVAEAEVA
jgi:hypothetical protein